MGLMNGIPWLTSPVIMTGLWVHAAKLTHCSWSKLTKLTLLTLFTTNLLITDQMALKYTHVCLFKPVFINVKVT